ncbi:MAG: cytochrome P450 [Actinomycetota bacterium]
MALPNGPTTHHFVQQLQLILNPLGYMEQCTQQYGEIFTACFSGLGKIVMISHPQAMQEILTSNAFDAPGRLNKLLKPFFGDQSMILLEGEHHKQRRQLLMPPFHGERMRNYGDRICTLTQEVAANLALGQPFIARSVMQEITMRVILHVVFGMDEGPRFQQLKPLLGQILDLTGSPLRASVIFLPWLQQDWGPWSPWGRMLRQQQQLDELLFAEIEERRSQADPNRTDILSLMLAARDEAGQGMTNEEVRDELMTMLVAGHETTATALAWAFYWIHTLPEVREKLLQELDSLGDNPDPMTIFRLPYLTAVCQETLRIYPVALVTFSREVRKPVNLMGHELEPGTVVAGSIYLAHRREEVYPEPGKFKPERFLERQFSPYEFLPFGGGARRCLGLALAQFEMKLVLATMLRDYELTLAEKKPVQPQRRGLTLAPAGGVRMVMTGRRLRQERPEPVATVV